MERILAGLLCLLLVIAPVRASQNTLYSPTTGTVSGLQLTNNYNNAIDSLNTRNSGSSAPTNQLSGVPSAGNTWLDTTSAIYGNKIYDGTSWTIPFYVDSTNHYALVKVGGGTATVSSATTTDICTGQPQAYITISGTTTITGFGSGCNAGHVKFITFSGILTLTYNATSMIIPGAANVTTAAGDQATVVSLGSGNWQVLNYTPASGTALVNQAVPVGMVISYAGFATPSSNYQLGYGQTVSRSTYSTLLTAVTSVQSVTRSNGSPTLTGFSDTTQFGYGMAVEGSGLASGTTILSCTSTTCTLNNNASSSGTSNVTVFAYGNGDGSTTFGLPNCSGRTLTYRDNSGGSAANVSQVSTTITTTNNSATATVASAVGIANGMNVISANIPAGTTVSSIVGTTVTLSANATAGASGSAVRFSATKDVQMLGSTGGNFIKTQILSEIAQHNHGISDPGHVHFETFAVTSTGGGSTVATATTTGNGTSVSTVATQNNNTGITVNNTGNGSPMLVQNPTIVMNCLIRVSGLSPRPHKPHAPRHPANDNAVGAPWRDVA